MKPKRTQARQRQRQHGRPKSEVDRSRKRSEWHQSPQVPGVSLPAGAGRKRGPPALTASQGLPGSRGQEWGNSLSLRPQRAKRGKRSPPSLSLSQSPTGRLWENQYWNREDGSVSCLAPLPGRSPHSLHPCPPGPKGVGYLTPGWLATAVPGRGAGVRPEAALAREWRHVWRRLQGDVGFGKGGPRRAGLLRQREDRALGGRRAATVRAGEKSISRGTDDNIVETCGGARGPPDSRPPPGWSPGSDWTPGLASRRALACALLPALPPFCSKAPRSLSHQHAGHIRAPVSSLLPPLLSVMPFPGSPHRSQCLGAQSSMSLGNTGAVRSIRRHTPLCSRGWLFPMN